MPARAYAYVLISRHYHDFTGADLETFAKGVSLQFNGYALVPVPIIALLTFDAQVAVLTGILAARVASRNTTLERDQVNAETIIQISLDALANQLEFLANQATPGDVSAIESAIIFTGYVPLEQPRGRDSQTFAIIATDTAQATLTNEVRVKHKLFIYLWAYTTTPLDPNSWTAPVMTTTSTVVLTGLTSGVKGYFRSAIIDPAGRKPVVDVNDSQIVWSDVISKIIP